MTDPRETLARIRAKADAATEGPWEHDPPPGPGEDPMRPICVYPKEDGGTLAYVQPLEADAAFIAAARTDVPWLLDQVESRDKALDAVRALHFERAELACGNPTHTVPDLMCPDCLTVCDDCVEVWPCPTVEAITAVLEGEPHD